MRTSVLSLIGVALALSCSAAPMPSQHPSASRSITVRNAPQELLLQLHDMPIGYRMLSDEPATIESLTLGQDRSLGRAQLASAGFVSGATRTFDFAGNSTRAPRRATAVLAISKDAAAAAIALDSVVPPSDPQITKVGIGETIGDGSIAYRLSPPESSDSAYVVATRYANVVAWFAVVGSSDSVGLKEPAALARREIAILRADTEGPPLLTPAPRSSPIVPVLFNLALRADDLPSGWKASAGSTLTINEIARARLVQKLAAAGFPSGFSRAFTSPDKSTTGNRPA